MNRCLNLPVILTDACTDKATEDVIMTASHSNPSVNKANLPIDGDLLSKSSL